MELAGCTLRGQKQAVAPPPPKPAVVQPPAPEPQLSIPQTVVQLPSAQPVNPDAIPPAPVGPPPAAEKAETTIAPKPARRASPPKPVETEAEAPAAAPAVEEPAPFQPILSGEEQKRLQGAIETRKREIDERLTRAKGRLSDHDRTLVDRINSFLTLSAKAAQRGDYTQADALSERALILARELQVE